MKFDYLDLLTIKFSLEYTQENSDALSFLDIINKLNIVINNLKETDKKAVLKIEDEK